eukprot:757945-Hanusia_phi.AAC.2
MLPQKHKRLSRLAKKQAEVSTGDSCLQEAGVVEKLAPVASVANETKTLFSQFGSSLEESFNKKTSGWATDSSFAYFLLTLKGRGQERERRGRLL